MKDLSFCKTVPILPEVQGEVTKVSPVSLLEMFRHGVRWTGR